MTALASTQVARRPALRRLIAIITVACALLVFAVDVWEVADRNRVARAGVQTGAPVVLTVDAANASTLRTAVLALDPRQTYATPVVTASSVAASGPRTTAVEPIAFARIAKWGSPERTPSPTTMRRLDTATVPALRLTGERLQLKVRTAIRGVARIEGALVPKPRPLALVLHLVAKNDNRSFEVKLSAHLRSGSSTFDAAVPCTAGCSLREVELRRDFGDFTGVTVAFAIQELRMGPVGHEGAAIELGPVGTTAWQSLTNEDGDQATVDPEHPISFAGTTFGSFLAVQRGDLPVEVPSFAAGDVLDRQFGPTFPNPPALAPDLTGVEASYEVAGRLLQIPRTGPTGVLVNLDLLDETVPPTTQTSYAVWLGADDPSREAPLVAALQRHGIVVTGRDSIRNEEASLSHDGPTLALRLALLAGLVSLLLAALVLVVGAATSSGSRARDLAGLRVAGVPARDIRRAAVREHVTVAALGTVAGVSLGLAAAQAALPRLPLFPKGGPRLPVVYDPAWSPVAVAGGTCLVLLVVVSVFVGRAVAASATPDRLRDDR